MKTAILTSPNQWFERYAEELSLDIDAVLFRSHDDIDECFDVLFLLSYHKLVPRGLLNNNKYNLVVHGSDLPKGKGWAPFFWQVLEGKDSIKFSLFEASLEMDSGDIYLQEELKLSGFELNNELREKQARLTIKMCKEFISNFNSLVKPIPQKGEESFYRKRLPEDSRLDINKTILEQFNLLRIVDNDSYPAFFELNGHRYNLKISKSEK